MKKEKVTREWVEAELSKGRKQFEDIDMQGLYLAELDFTGVTFINVCLREANITDAKLDFCYFENSDISYANFRGSRIMSSTFKGCEAVEVGFNGSSLYNSCMSDMEMIMPSFIETNLNNSYINNVRLINATFKYTSFMQAFINGCIITVNGNIDKCCFHMARIAFTTFSNVRIQNSDLYNSVILHTRFIGSNLVNCKQTNITLVHTDLRELDPTDGGNVECTTDLCNSIIIASNIRDANLENANMTGTTMASNGVIGAWFGGADFTGADLSKQNFFDSNFSESTKGIKHPFTGGIVEMDESVDKE